MNEDLDLTADAAQVRLEGVQHAENIDSYTMNEDLDLTADTAQIWLEGVQHALHTLKSLTGIRNSFLFTTQQNKWKSNNIHQQNIGDIQIV